MVRRHTCVRIHWRSCPVRTSRTQFQQPSAFSSPALPLSPMFPLHTAILPVSPLFPLDTKIRGWGISRRHAMVALAFRLPTLLRTGHGLRPPLLEYLPAVALCFARGAEHGPRVTYVQHTSATYPPASSAACRPYNKARGKGYVHK